MAAKRYPDHPDLWPVYRFCEDIAVPVIVHSGLFYLPIECAQARYFIPVLRAFPHLTLVLAHLGRPSFDVAREVAATFPNACFDTSAAICSPRGTLGVPVGQEVALVRAIGVERVLFGSDFPWYDPALDLEVVSGLGFSEGERRAILGENAARVFRL